MLKNCTLLFEISIHTLRVEGDAVLTNADPEEGIISIHTLRVEGDHSQRAHD